MSITLDRLYTTFEMLEDWEDRYRVILDLGNKLPEFPEEGKVEENRIRGCISQVWMIPQLSEDTPPKIDFIADSDSHIVKGLIAILRLVYSGKTQDEIREINMEEIFGRLGLEEHLSPNRRNGFYSMVEWIRTIAKGGAVHTV